MRGPLPRLCVPTLLLALTASGCGTARLYEGPTRPASQISILKIQNDRARVTIEDIDDVAVRARTVELLPGVHHVWVRTKYVQTFNSGFMKTSFTVLARCHARIETRAGHSYRLAPRVTMHDEGMLTESLSLSLHVEDEGVPGENIARQTCYY